MPSAIYIDPWFKEQALEALQHLKDDSQEWDEIQKDLNGIEGGISVTTAEAIFDTVCTPDANCSCHISPPCNDCVDHSGTRAQLEFIKAQLRTRYEKR